MNIDQDVMNGTVRTSKNLFLQKDNNKTEKIYKN